SYALAMVRPIDPDEISPADVALLSVLSWSGAMLIANDGLVSMQRLRDLVQKLAWAGGLLAALGVAQFLTNDILIDRISIPGLRVAEFEVFERGGFVRPSGTATHPIEFGIILAMMMPFALHSAYFGKARNLVVRWLPTLLLGVAIALTFSRSAYVSAGVALIILMIGWPARRRATFAAGLGALAVVLFAAVPRLFGTIGALFRNVGDDPSISSRTDSYDLAFEFIGNSPFFGRGLGTFLPKYRIFDNQYLVLLVSIGVVGTIAAVVLFLTGVWVALSVARSDPEPENRDVGLTIAAAIAAGAVSLATFDAFAFPMTMGTLFLVLGMAGAAYRLSSEEPFVGTPAVAPSRRGVATGG
ncbi:MAG: O-antigen ligase family protein, partial [Propionicimonas sp.]|nr:O-antigen ligase family protein [Propionicimonas sp.]